MCAVRTPMFPQLNVTQRIVVLSQWWPDCLMSYLYGLIVSTKLLMRLFYVLLTVHPCIILQISPTRCKFWLICLFHFSTCFGYPCAHHQEEITVSMRHWCCQSVWVASGLLSRRHPYRLTPPVSHRYSYFLLMMGKWMPETCREVK